MALILLNNTDTVIEHTRLDSDIKSKSLNNTYLNIIQILFLLLFFYFRYKDHQMQNLVKRRLEKTGLFKSGKIKLS